MRIRLHDIARDLAPPTVIGARRRPAGMAGQVLNVFQRYVLVKQIGDDNNPKAMRREEFGEAMEILRRLAFSDTVLLTAHGGERIKRVTVSLDFQTSEWLCSPARRLKCCLRFQIGISNIDESRRGDTIINNPIIFNDQETIHH